MKRRMNELPHKLVSTLVERPILSLLIGLACVAVWCIGLPSVRGDFTYTAFFRKSDPELQRFEAFERRFGNDDSVIIAVNSPSGVFDVETATLIRELTARMWKVSDIVRVDSLANFPWVHAEGDEIKVQSLLPEEGPLTPELLAERKRVALGHELLPGYLVSEDGQSALLYARVRPAIDSVPDPKVIMDGTREAIAAVARGDHKFHLLGSPVLDDAFRAQSEYDMQRLLPLLLFMVVAVLAWTFKHAAGVIIPFVVITMTILVTIGSAGWFDIPMSSVTMSVPNIIVAVCVAESVHLLTTFYQARRRGLERKAAAYHALRHNLLPTFLTSITTVAGFLSFSMDDVAPVAGVGVMAGIGTTVAWIVTYTMVGPILVLWPGKDAPAKAPAKALEDESERVQVSPRARAFVHFMNRHRLALVSTFGVLSAVSIYLGFQVEINSNPYRYFVEGVPVREAQDFATTKLSGIAVFELEVDSRKAQGIKDPAFLHKVEQFEERAEALPGITRAVSVVDILRQVNRALNEGAQSEYRLADTAEAIGQELMFYSMNLPEGMDLNNRVTAREDALRITLISTITKSEKAVQTARKLEALGTELGLKVGVTGKSLLYHGLNGKVVDSILSSLWLASLTIGGFMLMAFRSLRLFAISMIPSVVPLCVGAAALYLTRGMLDMGTAMVASVCLGIAVDNTIHLISGFQSVRKRAASATDALAEVLSTSGPAMIWTNVILISGFGTLALGTFVPNVRFGMLCAVILTAALIADLVLLPALLLMMDRRAPVQNAEPVTATGPALAA